MLKCIINIHVIYTLFDKSSRILCEGHAMACPYDRIVLWLFISKHLCMSNVKGECNSPLQRIIDHFNIGLYTLHNYTITQLHIKHYTITQLHDYTITHYTLRTPLTPNPFTLHTKQ